MGIEELIEIISGSIANILAATIIGLVAYIFRTNLKRFFRNSVLKSKNASPNLSLEISSTRNIHNEWETHFLIENMGEIEITDIRIYLCSNSSTTEHLVIDRIKIDSQRKWINSGGHRLQINTRTLHDGCNVTSDQRYFVEFIDDNDGTIYRLSRGAPSPEDGSIAFYGTVVCRKRLPRNGLKVETYKKKREVVVKYDIDLAIG